ncbi:MAG: hypothetical protein KA968_13635 [Chitinophagaceae bacterium]|nr:hypothetical protein [Chitinophagaceae bacterium]MBP7109041.1 hypothetical protein [Chitinophagaceae bacterium]MBP7316246.1 hypothetical protein [Chitinophagaceae bacterium]HQZ51280.1 hypothetical protein [Chitinophagaceae bacterium]
MLYFRRKLSVKKILLITLLISGVSCGSKDKKVDTTLEIDNIYFDYKISAEEGYDNLTVLLKYRDDDKNGDAFAPEVLKNIKLDEEILVPDSSKMGGVFYEIQKPINTFTGKHYITFFTNEGKEFKEEIVFSPMILTTVIPETIKREDLVLDFTGLENEDHVRIVLTDTSFFNDGVNRIDAVLNNQMILSKKDLESLADGPILLEFIREFERPIKNAGEAGGRVRINYTLRRSFNLQN